MHGGEIIRRARRRSHLTQAELAARLGTKQPVVARWERGSRSPSLATVSRVVAACGLSLDVSIHRPDPGEDALLRAWLRLSPAERLRRNEEMLATEEWAARARRADARR